MDTSLGPSESSGTASILLTAKAVLEAGKSKPTHEKIDLLNDQANTLELSIDKELRSKDLTDVITSMRNFRSMISGKGLDPYQGIIDRLGELADTMGGRRRRTRRRGTRKTRRTRRGGESVMDVVRAKQKAEFDQTPDAQIVLGAIKALNALNANQMVPGSGTLVIKNPGRLRDLFDKYDVPSDAAQILWYMWDKTQNADMKKTIETNGIYFNASANRSGNVSGQLRNLYAAMKEAAGIKKGGKKTLRKLPKGVRGFAVRRICATMVIPVGTRKKVRGKK